MHEEIPEAAVDREAIRSLLKSEPVPFDEAQVIALEEFIARAGGLSNARRAVEMLAHIEKAA
jgi:hypothetical protein